MKPATPPTPPCRKAYCGAWRVSASAEAVFRVHLSSQIDTCQTATVQDLLARRGRCIRESPNYRTGAAGVAAHPGALRPAHSPESARCSINRGACLKHFSAVNTRQSLYDSLPTSAGRSTRHVNRNRIQRRTRKTPCTLEQVVRRGIGALRQGREKFVSGPKMPRHVQTLAARSQSGVA